MSGQLNSTYLDLALLKREIESTKPASSQANRVTSTVMDETDEEIPQQQKQTLVFPDNPIELKAFDYLDLVLLVRVDEVANLWERGTLHDLAAKVSLKGHDFSVSDFEVRGLSDDKIHGTFSIGKDAGRVRIKTELKGENLRLGLATAPGQKQDTYPPTNIDAKLTGTGKTYREVAASLNGRIKVTQGQGRVNNSGLELLFSDVFYQLFQSINPFAKTERTTQLNCGVYISNLTNGIAEVQDVVIQTDKLTIVSAGTIDLRTERINVGFQTRPRTGVGISASMITNPLIRLGGTLAKPAIELDPTRASVATGAAVATGGLSILFKGVWDRYFTSRDPCGEALKRDAELQAKEAR